MLYDLHIENIAVIQQTDLEFTPGFNVLTGETGAGKSIVIDALNAVLGGRSSRELVRTGAERALVSARFSASSESVRIWMEDNGIDMEEDELLLLRRIHADGKTVCRVNGIGVTAAQLRELGSLLLDIHGQNDSRQLLDESRHRADLDSFAHLEPDLEQFAEVYDQYAQLEREIEKLSLDEFEKERRSHALTERIEELQGAELQIGEEDELLQRRDLMKNAGRLTEAMETAYNALYEETNSAIDQTSAAMFTLERVAEMSTQLSTAVQELNQASQLLTDAAELIRDVRSSLDFSPETYDALEARLALLRRLEKKYSRDEAGLLDLLEESRQELEGLSDAEGHIASLNLEREKLRKTLLQMGQALTEKRKAAAEHLSRQVAEELQELSMAGARFQVELSPVENEAGFDRHGCDQVRFLLSANAGQALGRISRIASGGELSRIMLALKNVFSHQAGAETMVFDEIDTGVSGIAAQRVGEKLAQLSQDKQVLCVTHLPQIAAMADTHFIIEKTVQSGQTYTRVSPLGLEGRIQEIARLYGGDQVTELTLRSAEEQLKAAENFKKEDRKKAR
jgi:DNA repair protein RecN (Recombination protein N)